jgi:ATP-binding cassette subfamily B protein RaxB
MIHCARLALIDSDIMALPMGYQTLLVKLVEDFPEGRSSAFCWQGRYIRNRFLLLDEATSHLDVESEIQISQTLRQLGLPVLLIAHRPETIASADRILYLSDGNLRS